LPESGSKRKAQSSPAPKLKQSGGIPPSGKSLKLLVLSFSFALCVLRFTFAAASDIKQPNVSGGFYPSDQKELSDMIDDFVSQAEPEQVEGDIIALISPHAGYGYSGAVAAYGYKLIKGKPYKTVVIIGPGHYYDSSGISVYPQGSFRTPLGDLEIDREFAAKLLDRDEEVFFAPEAFDKEHSIEVQLPFLQRVLSDFKIVPVVTGDLSLGTCRRFAQLLKGAIAERDDVLVILSSDLYHGYDYQECKKVDDLTIGYLERMDAKGLYYALREGQAQLCGGFGVVSGLILSKELGHDKLIVLDQTNSAEVTGRLSKGIWTVGYASCVIDQEEGGPGMLDKEQRGKLLKLARDSIKEFLRTGKKLEVTESDPVLTRDAGAFVTLHKDGELRGCIGNFTGRDPLYINIRDMAVEAATGDPRFPPVTLKEMDDIDIEISVLSTPEKAKSAEEVELGRHGVMVKKGFRGGVFLPQVATETGWSKEEFLSTLCTHKAGISADSWKDGSAEIYTFTAEVFSEKEL